MKHAGIIAAGLGERLQGVHPGTPKPLIEVAGRPLIDWVVDGLQGAGVDRLTILHNSRGDALRPHLKKEFPGLRWTFLRADTASSWETFRIVASALSQQSESFLMSTVDALVARNDIMRFTKEAFAPWPEGQKPTAAMALTRFVDDEKPLWADVGADGKITALGENAASRDAVTCGLYALTRAAAETMPPLSGHSRLREFWSSLVRGGAPVRGIVLNKSLDVDRLGDIGAAEEFLKARTQESQA